MIASDVSSSSPSSSEAFPFENSSRSYVWKYFRRDKCSVQCLLCNKAFVYNGGTTSNLISHLQRKHPSYRKPEAKQEGGQEVCLYRIFDYSFILGIFKSLGFRIFILVLNFFEVSQNMMAT